MSILSRTNLRRPRPISQSTLSPATIRHLLSSIRHPPLTHTSPSIFRQLWSIPSLRPILLQTVSKFSQPYTSSDDRLFEEAVMQIATSAQEGFGPRVEKLKRITTWATAIVTGGCRGDIAGGLLMACANGVGGLGARDIKERIVRVVKGWKKWEVRTIVGGLEGGVWLGSLIGVRKEEMGLVMKGVVGGLKRGEAWGELGLMVIQHGYWEEVVMVMEVLGGIWEGLLAQVEWIIEDGEVGVVHVAILGYLVEKGGKCGERGRRALETCLEGKCHFSGGGVGRSDRGKEWGVLVEGMRMVGKVGGGGRVLGVVEGMLWGGKGACLDLELLYELFVGVEGWRKRVIEGIGIGLKAGGKVGHTFCHLLETICKGGVGREVGGDVLKLLEEVNSIDEEFGVLVVAAVVKFGGAMVGLRERIWTFLRKGAGMRGWKMQLLVCCGLVGMAEIEGGAEAVELLAQVFERAYVSVKKFVVALVMGRLREGRLMRGLLTEMVLKGLWDICGRGEGEFKFWKSFEKAGVAWIVRDDLPLLLQFCKGLPYDSGEMNQLFERLMVYLQDVDAAIFDACVGGCDKAPVRMRITQLCSIYETVCCIEVARLSKSHVCAYAVTLLIRDHLASKSLSGKGGLEVEEIDNLEGQNLELHPLALLTIEEVCASKKAGNKKCGEEGRSLLVSEYMDLFQMLLVKDIERLPGSITQAELLKVVASQLEKDYRAEKTSSLSPDHMSKLVDAVKKCFISSCPWVNEKGPDTEMVELTDTADKADGDKTGRNKSDENEDPQQKDQLEEFQRICEKLTTADFLEENIKKALGPQQIQKVSDSSLLSIRQLAIHIFLLLLFHKAIDVHWSSLLSFLNEASLMAPEDTNGTDIGQNVAENEIQTMNAISAVFRLEFEHSLSISLTLSYLDLYAFVMDRVNEYSHNSTAIKNTILTTMKCLLRDYSIRHVRVLRSMTILLLKAFTTKEGLEFSASAVRWLGNESCLLNSRYASENEGQTWIGVEDFDIDILEAAISMDEERDIDEQPEKEREEERARGSAVRMNMFVVQERDSSARLNTGVRDGAGERDPVKSLCFNETAESAFLSIDCILSHCGKLVRGVLDRTRRYSREGFSEDSESQVVIAGVVKVLEEFFSTPFGKMKSQTQSKEMSLLHRKIVILVELLSEIAELQLKMAAKNLHNSMNDSNTKTLANLSMIILGLLFTDDTMAQITYLQNAKHKNRLTFFQEKLDSSVEAFLLCTKKREVGYLEGLCEILQQRVSSKISSTRREVVNDDFENVAVRPPRGKKRPRVRSRNRDVDGWLRDEPGEDNYADLEDFVVPLDAREL